MECGPLNCPGCSPEMPQPYRYLPVRSYFTIRFVPPSDCHRNWSVVIRCAYGCERTPVVHMSRNLPFSSNTWMRRWPRSTTYSLRSLLIWMLWTVFHSLGPGLLGSFGAAPQSIRNLPSLSNFATRLPP